MIAVQVTRVPKNQLSFMKVMEKNGLEKNAKVLIKPNIVGRENYPTTTDPKILSYLLHWLQKKGCKDIMVADGPSSDKYYIKENEFKEKHAYLAEKFNKEFEREYYPKENFSKEMEKKIVTHSIETINLSELANVCKKHRVPIKSLYDGFKYRKKSYGGVSFRIVNLSSFNLVFNLPVLKLHSEAGYTAARKNLFGLLHPFDKLKAHVEVKKGKISLKDFIDKLPGFIEETEIITILDTAWIQSCQERMWGPTFRIKGNGLIIGRDIWEIDKVAEQLLASHNLNKQN